MRDQAEDGGGARRPRCCDREQQSGDEQTDERGRDAACVVYDEPVLARVAVDAAVGHRVEKVAEGEYRKGARDSAHTREERVSPRPVDVERDERKRKEMEPVADPIETK